MIPVSDPQPQILAILQKLADVKQPLTVGADDSLFDAGILDSFLLPGLVSALEKAFGIKIPDSDLSSQRFETVNRIVEYVRSRS